MFSRHGWSKFGRRAQDQGQFVVVQTPEQFAESISQNAVRLKPVLAKLAPLIKE